MATEMLERKHSYSIIKKLLLQTNKSLKEYDLGHKKEVVDWREK